MRPNQTKEKPPANPFNSQRETDPGYDFDYPFNPHNIPTQYDAPVHTGDDSLVIVYSEIIHTYRKLEHLMAVRDRLEKAHKQMRADRLKKSVDKGGSGEASPTAPTIKVGLSDEEWGYLDTVDVPSS